MRKTATAILAILLAATMLSGCGKVKGPRFWWDDRTQERLPDYALPPDPGDPSDEGDFVSSPSGDDLTEDNLRDYRTNLDQEEEKRKSEASLLDF